MAGPSWDETTPISAPQTQARAPKGEVPTWDNTVDLEEKYGDLTGQAKAFGLGAARSASFGLSDEFLTGSGLVKPEDLKGYREQNPISSGAGEIAGIAGAILVPETGLLGAAAAPVKTISRLGTAVTEAAGNILPRAAGPVSRILSQAGAMGAGSAVEGAAYGLGQSVTEHALGDPDLNAEKVFANLGMGAVTGGALGSLFGAVKGGIRGKSVAQALESEKAMPGAVADSPKLGVKPTSIQDMADQVAAAKASGKAIDLPQKKALVDAASRIEMAHPIHNVQLSSLEDQGARDVYNILKETPDATGNTLRQYEALQKNDLVDKTEKAISDVAPGKELTSDAVEGGNKAVKIFSDQYQAEKNEAGKLIGEAKSLSGKGFDHLNGMVKAWTDAVPELSKMFSVSEDGIKVNPYDTTMGMTKLTYRAVREAVQALRKDPQEFKELFNIRKGLENNINVFNTDAATRGEIMRLKSSAMDYIQNLADESIPEIRDSFKRYAINEQERSVIEKAFGASVGSPEFGSISKIKPEVIGDRIFSNTATVSAAKKILSPENFNEVLGNWLSEAKKAATLDGNFSSKKFGTFLVKNQDALNEAFRENPHALQKLHDLTTVMRILPDAASVNPSGTAKTLVGMVKNMSTHGLTWEGLLASAGKKVTDLLEKQQTLKNLNNDLAGKSAGVDMLSKIERTANKTANAIKSGTSAIFSDGAQAAKSAATYMSVKEQRENHADMHEKLSDLTGNPEKLIDKLHENTEAVAQFAPKTAAGMQSAMARATQFLQSKLPQTAPTKPLSPSYKPSDADLSKWHSYFNAVENPTAALYSVAHGTLIPETMETLSVVYPKMLNDMRQSVMGKMTESISKKKVIPYKTKLSLSLFMGEDLVESLNPVSMIGNQNTMATATQSKAMQASAQMNSVNTKNAGNIKTASRYLTPMQKSADRKES